MIYLITSLVAFCSIVYELLLAQGLVMVWGNSLVRFAQTIGCYLFALGMGSILIPANQTKEQCLRLLTKIEILLALLGYILPFLLVIALPLGDGWLLWVYLVGLTFLVGFLSGMEIPLLMMADSDLKILALDYAASCVGAILFPLWLDHVFGWIQGAIVTGMLNVLAFGGLIWLRQDQKNPALLWVGFILLLGLGFILLIKEESYRMYLSAFMVS